MVHLKLFMAAVFWGGTFVAGRNLTTHMGPFSAAFLRFLLATVCMWAATKHFEGGLPTLRRDQLLPVGLLGLTGVFSYNALFFTGLQTVPAGRAAVIIAGNPVFIALFAALIFKEKLGWRKLLGICFSVAGAVTVITLGKPWTVFSGGVGWGELAIVGCVASWVTYSLVGKAVMGRLSPHAAVTYSCAAGTLFLMVPALAEGLAGKVVQFPAIAWLDVAYLGVCGTVLGFTWFYQGVKAIGPSQAGVFINFVPVSAIICSWFILGETVHLSLLAGGALVLTGVWLTNSRRRA